MPKLRSIRLYMHNEEWHVLHEAIADYIAIRLNIAASDPVDAATAERDEYEIRVCRYFATQLGQKL